MISGLELIKYLPSRVFHVTSHHGFVQRLQVLHATDVLKGFLGLWQEGGKTGAKRNVQKLHANFEVLALLALQIPRDSADNRSKKQ